MAPLGHGRRQEHVERGGCLARVLREVPPCRDGLLNPEGCPLLQPAGGLGVRVARGVDDGAEESVPEWASWMVEVARGPWEAQDVAHRAAGYVHLIFGWRCPSGSQTAGEVTVAQRRF